MQHKEAVELHNTSLSLLSSLVMMKADLADKTWLMNVTKHSTTCSVSLMLTKTLVGSGDRGRMCACVYRCARVCVCLGYE